MTAELSCYKLGRITSNDADGYHRVSFRGHGKVPLSASQGLDGLSFNRPQIICPRTGSKVLYAKEHHSAPERQRQDRAEARLPLAGHRRSYARRTAVERSNSRVKDPATIDVSKGWCRIMGLVPISLFLACALVVRNLAISDASQSAHSKSRGEKPPGSRRGREGGADEPQRSCWDDGQRLPIAAGGPSR